MQSCLRGRGGYDRTWALISAMVNIGHLYLQKGEEEREEEREGREGERRREAKRGEWRGEEGKGWDGEGMVGDRRS